jgi:phenylacetate-CoA ligase
MHADRPPLVAAAWDSFLKGARTAPLDPLEFFRYVAETVPGYRRFLDERGIHPASIVTAADFDTLPLLTKDTYHRRYRLGQLCRGGSLDGCDMIAVSSGSSGQPTPWPRSVIDELAIAARFEQVFRDAFRADQQTTLAVVCFPFGTWVGGLYTVTCIRHLNAKGYPVTVVAPGNNKDEILCVMPELAPNFDQVVLPGYPPFIKDVVDTGIATGFDWQAYVVKFVFAGEVFSEECRSLVGLRAGLADPVRDTAALYGTADAGVLGNETALSVTIRRFLARNPSAAMDLFGQSRLPTLVQYDPGSRYFQTHDGTLLFTGDNGIPLVRYHISDEGGVVGYDDMLAFCERHHFNPLAGLDSTRNAPNMPFVYLFGRSLFTVSYYGANIYPENISVGLEQPTVSGWVTGKFVLETAEDSDRDRILRVVVEVAHGQLADNHTIACAIRDQLLRLNSEFAHYVPAHHRLPDIQLRPISDPDYFPVGVKHRYTRQAVSNLAFPKFRAGAADRAHAGFMPDTAWPANGTPARLIPAPHPNYYY